MSLGLDDIFEADGLIDVDFDEIFEPEDGAAVDTAEAIGAAEALEGGAAIGDHRPLADDTLEEDKSDNGGGSRGGSDSFAEELSDRSSEKLDMSTADPSQPPRRLDPAALDLSHLPRVCNVLGRFDLGVDVSPRRILVKLRNSEYIAPAAKLRFTDPRANATIFERGGKVTVQARAFADLQRAARLTIALMARIGYRPEPSPLTVHNIVVQAAFRHAIRVDEVFEANRKTTEYEPALGKPLSIRVPAHRATVQVYVSGKIMVFGLRFFKDIAPVLQYVHKIVAPFMRRNSAPAPAPDAAPAAPAAAVPP